MITVNVTQEHIDKGKRSNECECPIALALHDLGYKECKVGRFFVDVNGTRGAELPIKARDFIEAFDYQSEPVYPFSFDLDI